MGGIALAAPPDGDSERRRPGRHGGNVAVGRIAGRGAEDAAVPPLAVGFVADEARGRHEEGRRRGGPAAVRQEEDALEAVEVGAVEVAGGYGHRRAPPGWATTRHEN